MTDQHAPVASPQFASGLQTASIRAHFKKGITENHNRPIIIRVRMVLPGLLSRFPRIHPIAPILEIGGFTIVLFSLFVCVSIIAYLNYHLSTSFIFLLYQFMKAEVDKLKNR